MGETKTLVNNYKRAILRMMREFWKSENKEMWCGVYTFIKYYTENERLKWWDNEQRGV